LDGSIADAQSQQDKLQERVDDLETLLVNGKSHLRRKEDALNELYNALSTTIKMMDLEIANRWVKARQ